jgi:cobalt-zinc-cadmium efflux system outer membrane protein
VAARLTGDARSIRFAQESSMRLSTLFFLALACPLAARGAESPLTLQAAVDLALARAPQITAGEAASESAHSLADSAGRLPDPQVLVGVDNLPVTGPDAYSVSDDFMTMRKVGLMQAFPAGAQRRSERSVAAAEITLADAELEATRYAVARATADAWVRYAATSDSLERLRALEEDMELGARTAMAALKSGRASTAEALAAEASVTGLKSRVLQLRGDLRREQAELARWIGVDAARPPAGLPPMDQLPAEAANLRASIHQHVSLRPLDAEVALSQAKLALAEAARRPGWSTEFSYAKRGPDYSDMVSLQFSVDLPLFVRHRQNPLIAARGADLRRAQAEREAELRMHQTEFEQMLASWETTGEQLSFIEGERVPLARERSRAALAAYRASQGDTRATLDAFQDETELLLERSALLIERGRAWSYLRYLTP